MTKINKAFLFSALLFGSSIQMVSAAPEVKITKFLLDEVEICNSELKCDDVERNTLPKPETDTVLVKKFDSDEGFLMFHHDGKELWVNITEVELNTKAVASITCTVQNPSSKSDSNTYATLGLGEGC